MINPRGASIARAWAIRGKSPVALAIVTRYRTMSAYARVLGVSPSALSRWVYGSRPVPPWLAEREDWQAVTPPIALWRVPA